MTTEERIQELEERIKELEETQKQKQSHKPNNAIPKSWSRRAFLGLLTALGITTTTGVVGAQQPIETDAESYCVLQGHTSERPQANPDCRWLYLEGNKTQPNSQVFRYSEGNEWRLFDNVPKNQYGTGFVDHPDYNTVQEVLEDVDSAQLGTGNYDGFTIDSFESVFGRGLDTNILTSIEIGNSGFLMWLTFGIFVSGEQLLISDNLYTVAMCFINQPIQVNGDRGKIQNNTFSTNTITVDGNQNAVNSNTGGTSSQVWNITLNGDENTVIGNTNVTVTDNGLNNQVANNT